MSREFELKYRATPAILSVMAAEYPGGKTISMETTYYDVPSGALGTLHWTLRRRFENGVSVCTLKTPCPDGGRGEWEAECPDILTAVPLLIAAGAPAELAELTKDGVHTVCGARFTRQAVKIDFCGAELELAMDSGVLIGGGREIPLCEAEVELKSGTDAHAIAFAKLLAQKYTLVPEEKSKFKRAKDLAER